MHLYVAILPPEAVCEAVADVVRSAVTTAATAVEGSPPEQGGPTRRSLFGRKREDALPASVAAPAVAAPQLDHVPPTMMQLPIASFGNVTVADAKRLSKALRGAVAPLTAPSLHLAGSAALEFTGDQAVWAQVHGDLEELRRIPPQITRIVEPLGFFVDRRQFRPLLSVATITDATSIEVLQRVVDELAAFHGESWTVGHVSLMERRLDLDSRSFEEIEQIPLASA